MKRYTGQKALYEAISRSRGKAKRGSILEKLRPVLPKQTGPVAPEPKLPAEPLPTPAETPEPPLEESGILEPSELQAVAAPLPPLVEQDSTAEPMSEMPPEPMMQAAPEALEQTELVVKPRPMERLAPPIPPGRAQTWLRPRPVQFNEGRIEVSVPYYVGLIVALAVSVVALAAYRLGQARAGRPTPTAVGGASDNPAARPVSDGPATTNAGRTPANPPATTTDQKNVVPGASSGDHLIVLTRYATEKDLKPVVEHFARYGVGLFTLPLQGGAELFRQYGLNPATLPAGTGFLLLTRDLCSNPSIPGSDGEKLKQRVTEVGALYRGKNPQGYESFAPNYFKDAYGMKVR